MKKRKRDLHLKRLSINEKAYRTILKKLDGCTEQVNDIRPYEKGYRDTLVVRYTNNVIICDEFWLEFCGILKNTKKRRWYQYYCVYDPNVEQVELAKEEMSPVVACKMVNKVIHEKLTEEERIARFTNPKNEEEKGYILHEPLVVTDIGKIEIFEDCYYYDMNGAYAGELIKMFPECREKFEDMFMHRHDNNNRLKKVFNYYVGCLTQNDIKRQAEIDAGRTPRTIYPKTRNHIINNITRKVERYAVKLKPTKTLYINTDGLIVQTPKNVLPSQTDIGTFKIEHQGRIYVYRDKNYTIFQYGNEIKGTLPQELRQYVDLREGRVVHYNRVLSPSGMYYEYKNIEIEHISVGGNDEEK